MSVISGVPVTEIVDRGAITESVVQGGTVATTGLGGGPVMAYIVGGTIGASFSFIGSVTTDIGNVKIEDADDNYGTIPAASLPKIPSTNALVVQHIDDTGTPLREYTQVAIRVNGSNANETLANIDLNTMASATYLAEIATYQGTQSTAGLVTIANNQGTQATSALQAAGQALAAALYNAQGTLATSAGQTAGNAVLVAIMNAQGTQGAASATTVAIMNNQGTQATSANQITAIVNGSTTNDLLRQMIVLAGTTAAHTLLNAAASPTVSATYETGFASQIAIQHIITGGTASINLRTSLNGVNWFTERTSTANEIFLLQGPTKYISADYTNGNATVTTLLLASAPGGGGGGGVASSGTTNQFGAFSVVLSPTLNATYDISVDGYNGVGLHIKPPTGGRIEFEGSFDGVNFTAITLREVGANGYTQGASYEEDYIGSIACLAKIRFRTGIAGSAPGSCGGRMTVPSNTLEGIEHGNAPHNIGYLVVTKHINFTGSIYNHPLWVPAPLKKPVITDIHFTVDDETKIMITDGAVGLGSYLFNAHFKPGAGKTEYVPLSFRTPHVTTRDGTVYYSQDDIANVIGVMHGYEVGNPPIIAS
jgi:hypothetical protein